MKRLVAVSDIKDLAGTGKKALYVEPGTIITPAARDAANEMGISISFGQEPEQVAPEAAPVKVLPESLPETICPDLIAKIVMEVIANLPQYKPAEIVKEVDPGGLRLVRGSSIRRKTPKTGNVKDKVEIKELFTPGESPNLCAGIMILDRTSCRRNLSHEEIDYIVEGSLEITVNGKTYRGNPGDVIYIPADSSITFSSSGEVKLFFVTHPANRPNMVC